jgi:hypothetical protein
MTGERINKSTTFDEAGGYLTSAALTRARPTDPSSIERRDIAQREMVPRLEIFLSK